MGFLEKKAAVITGATKGIGLAIAEALLKEGASVLIAARHEDEVKRVTETLRKNFGDRICGYVGDVRSGERVIQLMAEAEAAFGRIDVLVNNAGVGIFEPVEKLSFEQWRQVIETNLSGIFYCCHEVIPRMKRVGGGWIINIGSLAGKNAFPTAAAYNASKFGLIGFSEALMQEVRHDDIRVSYIMPGSVDTDFGGDPADESKSWRLQPEDIAQVVLDLLRHHTRSLPSRVEIRPSKPPKK